MRYRLAYVEGLRADRDTDSQRQGTAWHAAHEAFANAGGSLEAGLQSLASSYAEIPTWADRDAWALEYHTLTICFGAYHWYWQNDPVEFLASELPFNLPLHEPLTGMPLSMESVQRVGKIDHLIRRDGAVCVLERKTTSKSIAPDSDYWQRWQKDTQASMYALALIDLRDSGQIPFEVREGERFGNTLVDILHKPTIRPAWLSQKDTAALIDSGKYMEQEFTVEGSAEDLRVNGVKAEVEQGKKGFAIKETIDMYGARLLQDIYERPEFYFARREIARTDKELRAFRKELYAIYRAQSEFARTGCWFSNESNCRATFACQYIPVCFGPGADSVCDGTTVPNGFKRIYSLPVLQTSIEESD